MPPDHNQQHSRRPHYHRGRRGPDRRGGDRRPSQSPQPQEPANRDQLDVEQIMREIRSRISERHGIDLTAQQIQELAARRLEAILDPRIIKPSLMDELRRAAGLPADTPPSEPEGETIAESALYQSESGFVRGIRKMLNPLLKLFFNPAAIVEALNAQTRRAKAAEAREAELRRRQTEWNALHFEVLRRLVTDVARAEIDNQHLAHRVESLTARVDFNERRVRGVEHSQHAQHTQQPAQPGSSRLPDTAVVSSSPSAPPPKEESPSIEHPSSDASPEGSRRRRRRRRGRRSGQLRDGGGVATPGGASAAAGDQGTEGDEFDDEPTAEELIDEANNLASTVADEPVAVDFSAPAPPSLEPSSSGDSFEADSPAPDPFDTPPAPEESLHVVSSPVEQASPSQETSPTSSLEPTERPEPVPPDRS